MAEVDLVAAVDGATQWAIDGDPGRAQALAHLARELARYVVGPAMDDAPAESLKELLAKKATTSPPTAALAKELRATLEDLEGLRDGDDAQGQLVSGLSTPVLHGAGSQPTDIRTARRKGGGGSR